MTIHQGTQVPAAVDAILAGLGPTLLGAPVLDGLPPQWPKSDCVVIGVTMPGTPSVTGTWDFDVRTKGYSEGFDITCAAWSWALTTETMASRRRRCGDLFDAVRAWLDANPSLGLSGATFRAHMGVPFGWVGKNRGDGNEMTLGFTIHVPAPI